MRVIVNPGTENEQVFEPETCTIVLQLSPSDKANITSMIPEAQFYGLCPDEIAEEDFRAVMVRVAEKWK